MIDTVFQVFIALVVVIFLIYTIAFAAKKRRGGSAFLSMIEYLSLGPKRGIAVVRVGKKALVLGVTQTDFKLLKTLGEQEVQEIAFKKTLDTEMSRGHGMVSDVANRIKNIFAGKTDKES
ncbi:flagellar biosynthetic protein FliO [Candidatus Magnetominusculus dajiuhuensis]|uniref:flagellar biosynthetic protein FliO n=1 Tax=Candidatus Magnetominusculus dajiuhuensis TaxID=3137712 RepID=UPI003B436E68